MTTETETEIEKPKPEAAVPIAPTRVIKKKLTLEEQMKVWETDEYHGKSGSYKSDPYTGKRTPIED